MNAIDRPDAEERFARLEGISWAQFERFRARGVSAPALVNPELLARALVVFHPDTPFFDFAEDVDAEESTRAFVFLARDELNEPCDLVAWTPEPARLAHWYGRASMLGLESLWAFRLENDGALSVHETVLEWLQDNRSGVVLINQKTAAPVLRDVEHIRAANPAHGVSLRKLLTATPRIVVPKPSPEPVA